MYFVSLAHARSTVEASTHLLEISIAFGEEEQRLALENVFAALWRRQVIVPAVAVPLECSDNMGEAEPDGGCGAPDIPPGEAGEKFAETWLDEIWLTDRLGELQE